MWETWVRSLGREDPLEKEMATHSSILAWRIPRTEEPGGLQSMGSQRVRHDWSGLAAVAAAGFSNMWTKNLQMIKLDLEKAEESEIKLPTSVGSRKKQESSREVCTSGLLTMPKLLTVWITINCGKFLKRWEYQTTWPASWEICMQVKKQQLELDMEQQQTGSKEGKEYVKAVYYHPAYLTYMQSTSSKMPG